MNIVVVVPFLNEQQHLPTLLTSIARQARHPSQLLLVDDGSTDASPEIAAQFAADGSSRCCCAARRYRANGIDWSRRTR